MRAIGGGRRFWPDCSNRRVPDWADFCENSSMDVVALVVAILSFLVAAWTLWTTQNRETERVRRERAKEEREQATYLSTQEGRPSTDFLRREPGAVRAFRFKVTNAGKSDMSDVLPTLIDNSGNVISIPLETKYLPFLLPNHDTEFVIGTSLAADGRPLYLKYEWGDALGKHQHVSNVEIPFN
jgi:hypothetical protein